MISCGGISCSVCGIRSCSARSARTWSIGCCVSSDQATTRTSAPSSSRTDWSNFDATNSMTSWETVEALALGLELQDRDPRLEVGRLDVDAQPPPEPADQPFLQPRQLVRRPVGRDHDLPRAAVQVVERVEELGLRLLALGEELDVVDQQDVDLAVALAEPVALPLAHRLDELGHELLRRHVLHADPGVEPVHVVPTAISRCVLPSPTPP